MNKRKNRPSSTPGTLTTQVNGPRLSALSVLTRATLIGGMFLAASGGNFSLGAGAASTQMPGMTMKKTARTPVSQLPDTPLQTPTKMGGLVMPPGMIMTASTSQEAMQDMAAVDLTKVKYTAPVGARGDQPLAPRTEKGVKVFNLETSLIQWSLLPGVQVGAYAVNHQVPGPRLRLTVGDRVRLTVKNNLPEGTTLHWHGLMVPNAMDGAGNVTQPPIAPGKSFTYEFTATQAGTFFYHSHTSVDRQQGLGLYGAMIVEPKNKASEPRADAEYILQLQEWTFKEGYTFPSMVMEGLLPNYFTINGKAYPSTDTLRMKVGQTVKLRFIGSNNNFIHPMHLHGGPFEVVARDGNTLAPAARFKADTLNIGPGQRYDVIWTARAKGTWLIHCHIPHHITNDNVEVKGGGGLTMAIVVN